ncbi:ParB/RepB/Spo0J family partition protein, partial [Ancrocorticia populi]
KPVASKGTASKDTASKDTGNKTESSEAAAKKSKAAAKKSAAEAVSEEPTGDSNAEGLVAVPGTTYAELELDSIVPNQRQPRSVFDEDELEELAASIKQVGVLQPVIVRPLTEPIPDQPGVAYELIMGERRWRASQRAGEERIPAIVRRTSDEDLLRDALLENLHRAELNPLEEAAAYQQLLEDFNCTQDELAKRLARSRPQITNTLRLMKLPPLVQRRVAAHILSAGHARALLGLSDPAAMERLAQRIVAEGLSVRQVEEIVAMGEDPEQPVPQRRRPQRYTPELGELSGKLADRFETKVKVNMGLRKGSIKIDFASIEDLNRILGVMSPEINAVDIESSEENE